MGDPKTYWLNVTNIALGGFVAAYFLVVAVGLLCEILRGPGKRRSDRAELKHDMHVIFRFPQHHRPPWLHHHRQQDPTSRYPQR